MDLDDKGLGFPLRLGADRGIAVVSLEDSVRAMLEQILFTLPGERVNRPTFGVGVQNYVFEPNSPTIAEQLRVALDENVFEHLGKSVRVLAVAVDRDEEKLSAIIAFEVVGTVSGRQTLEVVVPTGGSS
jgi:phage baseplate assembly protein W